MHAGAPGVVGVGGDRRVLDGLDHRVGDRAAVEALGARGGRSARRCAPGRGCEAPCRRRGACRPGRGRAPAVEGTSSKKSTFGCVWSNEGLVDDEAVARDVDRRPERLGQRDRPVAAQRLVPASARSRARRPRARCSAPSLNASGAPSSQKESGRIAAGAFSRRSIVVTSPSAGADDHEAAAADPAGERLGDPEHAGGHDRGVDGVGPVTQRLDRGRGGEHVDGRGRPAGADRRRRLDRRWRLRRRRRRNGQGDCERRQREEQAYPGTVHDILPLRIPAWRGPTQLRHDLNTPAITRSRRSDSNP